MAIYNVYCDESCYLEHDGINVMSLGAVFCPIEKVRGINKRIIEIKSKHNVSPTAEIKWTKVGPCKKDLYQDVIDYFFDDDDLHFRCLVVPDKSLLDHKLYHQTHDEWYYKMYFEMLKAIFNPADMYRIFVDIKDSHSATRTEKLHEVCCNSIYDFSARVIKMIQPIRSNEVQIMQIVDILTGALTYANRKFEEGTHKSATKASLIERIKDRSGYTLLRSTLLRESKFNVFRWEANYSRP